MKTSTLTRLNPLSLIVLLTSILASLPAFADTPSLTYQGASIYKDSKGMVYKVSTADVSVKYSGVQVSKSVWSDACGVAKISFSVNSGIPSTVTFGGSTSTLSSLSSRFDKYKCVNGVADWGTTGAQTSVVRSLRKNSDEDLIGVTVYYPPTQTGGAVKQNLVMYTNNLTYKAKPTCGFVLLNPAANSQKRTSTALALDGTSIDLTTLPINPAPPECVKGKLFTGGASTAAVNGASIYRTDKAVVLAGLTPNSLNVVNFDVFESKSFKTTGSCGLFKIDFGRKRFNAVKIGASTFNVATISTTAVKSCSSAGFAAMTPNTLYVSDGWYSTEYYYKNSDLSQKSLAAEIPYVATKKIAVNNCGFTIVPSPNMANGFSTGDKLIINGSAPYNVTTLPLVAAAPICKNGVTYTSAP
jgi:hypothetical protein